MASGFGKCFSLNSEAYTKQSHIDLAVLSRCLPRVCSSNCIHILFSDMRRWCWVQKDALRCTDPSWMRKWEHKCVSSGSQPAGHQGDNIKYLNFLECFNFYGTSAFCLFFPKANTQFLFTPPYHFDDNVVIVIKISVVKRHFDLCRK